MVLTEKLQFIKDYYLDNLDNFSEVIMEYLTSEFKLDTGFDLIDAHYGYNNISFIISFNTIRMPLLCILFGVDYAISPEYLSGNINGNILYRYNDRIIKVIDKIIADILATKRSDRIDEILD